MELSSLTCRCGCPDHAHLGMAQIASGLSAGRFRDASHVVCNQKASMTLRAPGRSSAPAIGRLVSARSARSVGSHRADKPRCASTRAVCGLDAERPPTQDEAWQARHEHVALARLHAVVTGGPHPVHVGAEPDALASEQPREPFARVDPVALAVSDERWYLGARLSAVLWLDESYSRAQAVVVHSLPVGHEEVDAGGFLQQHPQHLEELRWVCGVTGLETVFVLWHTQLQAGGAWLNGGMGDISIFRLTSDGGLVAGGLGRKGHAVPPMPTVPACCDGMLQPTL